MNAEFPQLWELDSVSKKSQGILDRKNISCQLPKVSPMVKNWLF